MGFKISQRVHTLKDLHGVCQYGKHEIRKSWNSIYANAIEFKTGDLVSNTWIPSPWFMVQLTTYGPPNHMLVGVSGWTEYFQPIMWEP